MAVRNDITVDFGLSPRIITVAAPSVAITVQDLHDTLRTIEDSAINTSFDHLINSAGKEPLGGGVVVGITSTLQNAKLAFEARPGPTFVQCTIAGGNLVAIDSTSSPIEAVQTTAFTQIIRTSSSSATLQEQEDIQHTSFDGGVTIDVINGSAGTTFPLGTTRAPVNNIVDAHAIDAVRGFGTFFIKGAFTFSATDNVDNCIIRGVSSLLDNVITIIPGCSTQKTRFEELVLGGTLKGDIETDSVIFKVIIDMGYGSWLINSWLVNDVTLKGGGQLTVVNCGVANLPGTTARPTFDYTNVPTASSNFLRWSGNIGFRNITAGNVALNINQGRIFLENTNTAGEMVINGEQVLDDQSGAGFNVVVKPPLVCTGGGAGTAGIKTNRGMSAGFLG